MKIQIVSDLHLEFKDIDLRNEQGADVLILSGDILLGDKLRKPEAGKPYRDFLQRVSREYPNVVYVAGNHEFYHGKWNATIDTIRLECEDYDNVHFLECDSVEIMGVTFVGGTLWTDMNKHDPLTLHAVRDMMSDFAIITDDTSGYTKLKPATTVLRHRKTLDYIKQVVLNVREKGEGKVVVVGHHCPSHQSVHPIYAGQTLMNGAYYSELSEFILDRPEIVLWTHGHTHHPFDYMIGDCRVVCNPRGYVSEYGAENPNWNPFKIVEL